MVCALTVASRSIPAGASRARLQGPAATTAVSQR